PQHVGRKQKPQRNVAPRPGPAGGRREPPGKRTRLGEEPDDDDDEEEEEDEVEPSDQDPPALTVRRIHVATLKKAFGGKLQTNRLTPLQSTNNLVEFLKWARQALIKLMKYEFKWMQGFRYWCKLHLTYTKQVAGEEGGELRPIWLASNWKDVMSE